MANIQVQDYNRLLNRALMELPGATEAGIKSQLFDVLTEFFGDSTAWTEDLTVSTVAGTQDYLMTPVENGRIIRLQGVWNANGSNVAAFMPTFGTLHLANSPSQAENLTVRVAKNVTMPNTKDDLPIAPDWVLQQYPNTILDGLLGQMMIQSNKSYSDEKLGLFHYAKFRDGIAVARVEALRAKTAGAQAWSYPQGFRTYGQRSFATGNDRAF